MPADPLVGYLREQWNRFVAAKEGAGAGDPEAVHELRVALRRLRAALASFTPAFGEAGLGEIGGEIGWLLRGLGAERDAGVLVARIGEALAGLPCGDRAAPGPAGLERLAAERLASAHGLAGETLASPRAAAVLARLEAVALAPPLRREVRGPAWYRRRVNAALRRARMRLEAVEPDPGAERDAQLHAARRAVRRARFAAEAASPVLGPGASRLARRLAELQDVLGAHQDAVVARAFFRRQAGRVGEEAFVCGVLWAGEQARAEEASARVASAWRAAWRARL